MKKILNSRRKKPVIFTCYYCRTMIESDEYVAYTVKETHNDITRWDYYIKEVCPVCNTDISHPVDNDTIWEDAE